MQMGDGAPQRSRPPDLGMASTGLTLSLGCRWRLPCMLPDCDLGFVVMWIGAARMSLLAIVLLIRWVRVPNRFCFVRHEGIPPGRKQYQRRGCRFRLARRR